jgi:hypothetical protein
MVGLLVALGSNVCRAVETVGVGSADCIDHDGMLVLGGITIVFVLAAAFGGWSLMRQ